MRKIKFIVQKEFKQIFRNKMMLPIIFAVPFIQLIVLSYTATFEIKNVTMGVMDLDHTEQSRALINKFSSSPFYSIDLYDDNRAVLDEAMQVGDIEQILVIPNDFGTDLQRQRRSKVQLITDAVDGNAAGIMNYYALSIIQSYSGDLLFKETAEYPELGIQAEYSYWYNPELDYKTHMVPGILVLLVTLIGAFLSGMNIVKEKEMGTIEQLNVTPIKKHEFIIGKLLPFWIIAMFEMTFGLVIAKFIFAIPILGSIGLIFGGSAIYMLVVLGIGLFISTITNTQQQAMFFAWFFMLVFIMLSGLFTPIDSMPEWAKQLNILNPIAYFIEFMRMVMLKGSQFKDVAHLLLSISIYAVASLGLSVWRYKKTS